MTDKDGIRHLIVKLKSGSFTQADAVAARVHLEELLEEATRHEGTLQQIREKGAHHASPGKWDGFTCSGEAARALDS